MILTLIEAGLINPGSEYYWRRTGSWNWFGETCWWEVFVTFANGMHGGGGACVTEHWRWNSSRQTIRKEYRTLSAQETNSLVQWLVDSGQIKAELERGET